MRAHTTYSMPMDGYVIDDHITPIPSRIPPKQRFEGKQGIHPKQSSHPQKPWFVVDQQFHTKLNHRKFWT